MVLDAEMEEFLHSGCALIVGLVAPDGEPHGMRAWGLTVLHDDTGADPDPGRFRVRLLVDADDAVAMDLLASEQPIAVTGACVRTLRSVQFKGRALGLQPPTDADLERLDRYCDDFFTDIVESDRVARPLVERMRPSRVVPCLVEATELFDQTPGPGAGGRLGVGDA